MGVGGWNQESVRPQLAGLTRYSKQMEPPGIDMGGGGGGLRISSPAPKEPSLHPFLPTKLNE